MLRSDECSWLIGVQGCVWAQHPLGHGALLDLLYDRAEEWKKGLSSAGCVCLAAFFCLIYLAFSVCILVLSYGCSSFYPLCKRRTQQNGEFLTTSALTEPCKRDGTLHCSSWLCISGGVILHQTCRSSFWFVMTERKLTLASGAFSLALNTSSRFAAEEDKHALIGILLSPGINLSIWKIIYGSLRQSKW